MTLIVLEKRERLIPKGGIETKHSAATTLQLPLMFDALEWRSMVEFRPGRRPTARLYDFRRNYYTFSVSLS